MPATRAVPTARSVIRTIAELRQRLEELGLLLVEQLEDARVRRVAGGLDRGPVLLDLLVARALAAEALPE
jgi:hypothetical protein